MKKQKSKFHVRRMDEDLWTKFRFYLKNQKVLFKVPCDWPHMHGGTIVTECDENGFVQVLDTYGDKEPKKVKVHISNCYTDTDEYLAAATKIWLNPSIWVDVFHDVIETKTKEIRELEQLMELLPDPKDEVFLSNCLDEARKDIDNWTEGCDVESFKQRMFGNRP